MGAAGEGTEKILRFELLGTKYVDGAFRFGVTMPYEFSGKIKLLMGFRKLLRYSEPIAWSWNPMPATL
jgi:hypothetical protein